MRGKWLVVLGVLVLALMSTTAAVPRDATQPSLDRTVPVAIAQPLATMEGAPFVAMPRQDASKPILPESGMLLLVGGALLGLAAIVRRTT